MNKRKLILPFVSAVFLAILLLLLNINKTTFHVNIDDENNIKTAILNHFEHIAPNATIHKIAVENEIIFVLYSDSSSIKLKLFEKAFPIGRQYRSKGGASSSSQKINTYSFTGEIANSNGLIVVFGDNTEINASSYAFVNDGNEYKNTIADNYFIDTYFFDEMRTSNSSGIIFFDSNGDIILVP